MDMGVHSLYRMRRHDPGPSNGPGRHPAILTAMDTPASATPPMYHLAVRSPDDPTLANTFGAWLICASIGSMLFGLTTHQTYRYFRLYPTDKKGIKIMVTVLLVLDLLHTATTVQIGYYYLVVNYLNPAALASGVWSLRLCITETGLTMAISHSFFLRRIFLLGGRRLFPVMVITLLMASAFDAHDLPCVALAFTIGEPFPSSFSTQSPGTDGMMPAVTVMTFVEVTFAAFKEYQWMVWVLLANAIMTDVAITGLLIFFLRRSRTGFKRTDSILDILMVYTINTGLSTSIITVPAMICAIIMPDNLIWSGIYVIATKMYTNSLLAVLNSRRSIVDRGLEGFETGSFGLQVISQGPKRPYDFNTPLTPRPDLIRADKVRDDAINVKVTTETFIDITSEGGAHHHASTRGDISDAASTM
ncbi:hypothetical protein NUW54_g4822 [Trametes sanguinea]|uniref:Uncharacterized protein n=2 Tax=Trametes sanguinea TaxID=158606 RepID=A0ACC1PXW6_9APHY|nr:hypothetical protein NUW54_g5257 [Trametes sanguinea]KAJ3004425.1 hypothetical protein NUW54_g4822 [Trametes sanguinea]